MSCRLLFFCFLLLVVSSCLAYDHQCYELDDEGKDKTPRSCGEKYACCYKSTKGGKAIDKGCFTKSMCESLKYICMAYDRKKHGTIRDSGKIPAFKGSDICLCKGNKCNSSNPAPFAVAALLALLAM